MYIDPNSQNNNSEDNNQEKKEENTTSQERASQEQMRKEELKKSFKEHSIFIMPVILIFVMLITSVGVAFFVQKKGKKITSFTIDKPAKEEPRPDLFAGFSKLEIDSSNVDDNFFLKPESQDSIGISGDTSFVLTSKEKIETKLIKEIINIEPKDAYVLEEVSGQEWKLVPKDPLKPNTMVKVALAATYTDEEGEKQARDFSWVYQVKDTFKVLHSIPRDAGTNVPTNTGFEVTFSHDNYIDFENYFEVSPKTEGRFEKHGRTLVFVPTEQLNPGTIYTMTVKKGMPLQDSSETLDEDYEVTFETRPDSNNNAGTNFSVYRQFVEASALEPLTVQVYAKELPDNRINVNIYRYDNWQDYLAAMRERDRLPWWSYAKENYLEDTSKLTKYTDYSLEIKEQDRTQYVEFPESLPLGFYLIEFYSQDIKKHMWTQISNLATYYNVTKTDTLFWINDAQTKSPVGGVSLELLDASVRNVSDSDGIVRFPTPEIIKESATSKSENERYYYKINNAQDNLIIPATQSSRSYYWSSTPIQDDYWTYLYTDRPRYQSNDVIKFWGMIKDRNKAKITEDISIAFNKEGYVDYYYRPILIKEFKVELTSDNTFEGEIKLQNIRPDYYTLELRVGNEVITRKYVNIRPYIKPAYNLTLTPDRQYAFADEIVNLKAKASFFEGTPVPDLKLVFTTPDGKETVTTDENGEVDLNFSKKYYKCTREYSCWPEYETLSLTPEDSELAEITANAYLRFYGARVYLETEHEYPEAGKAKIMLKTKEIDLDRLNGDYSRWPGLGDRTAAGTKVEIKTTKITYTQEETGTSYDFINKRTYKTYRYNRHEDIVDEQTIFTDQKGEYTYELDTEPKTSYRIELKAYDAEGKYHKYTSNVYYYDGKIFRRYNDWQYSYYHLELPEDKERYLVGEEVDVKFMHNEDPMPDKEKGYLYLQLQNGLQEYEVKDNYEYRFDFEKEDIPNVNLAGIYFDGQQYITTRTSYWGMSVAYDYEEKDLTIEVKTDKEKYKPGEEVELRISVKDRNNVPIQAQVNLNLVDEAYYAVAQDYATPLTTIYRNLGSGIYYQETTHESLAPAMEAAEKGGCFTGDTLILMANGTQKPIKEIKEGEWVETLMDPLSGKKDKGQVTKIWQHLVPEYMIINHKLKVTPEHQMFSNYRFIDAGLLKVGDWLLDSDNEKIFIESIEIKEEIIAVYNLRIEPQHTYFAGGFFVHNQKKGGGPREFFTDAALFKTVSTNNYGQNSVKFTLPDNITSWRVTAQAISPDLHAGVSVTKIPVSLPVFEDVTIGDEYLLADKPIAKMRAFGTALKKGDEAVFSIEAESLGLPESAPLESTAFVPTYIELPKLVFGNHDIVYNLTTAKGSDAIKLPMDVISSRLEAQVAKTEVLTTETKVVAENDLPLVLIMSDLGQNMLFGPLQRLNWTWGDRVDQRLVKKEARKLLNKYYEKEYKDIDFEANNYQVQSGGITLLPYSSEELELSARVAAIGAPYFDRESLAQFFFKKLEDKNSNQEEITLALFGLASLEKPVLPRINSWLGRDDLTPKEKIYLAQALFDLGAQEWSRQIYYEIMSKYAQEKDPHIIIKVSENTDEVFHATALMAVLATALNTPEAKGMWDYLIENQVLYGRYKNSENLFNLEKLNYIEYTLPNLKPSPASVTYELYGEEREVEITGGRIHAIRMLPEEVGQIKFTQIQGEVGLATQYTKPIDLDNVVRDQDISIKREYYVNNRRANEFSEKDMIQVRIYPNFSAGALKGSYQITDILPSGLMPVTKLQQSKRSYNCKRWYPYNTDGQRVKYQISKDWNKWYCGGNYFYYYARPRIKGEFRAEPAIIQSFINPEYINYSNTETIIIR